MIEKIKRVLVRVDLPSKTPPNNNSFISNTNDIIANCTLPLIDLVLIQRNGVGPNLENGDVIYKDDISISPLDGENRYWKVAPSGETNTYSCLIDNLGVISMISVCI